MTGVLVLMAVVTCLLVTGIPIAIAIAISGLGAGWLVQGSHVFATLPLSLFTALNSFLLVAIPLFILMGEIMKRAGITEILFEFVSKWVGHWPGGLGISTVITSALGATITGSSTANAASMAIAVVPPMLKRGYDAKFVLGLVAAGGTLGILIPPSIPFLLYATITGESVAKLFIAGVIPGLVLSVLLILYVLLACMRGSVYQPMPKATWSERWRATRRASGALLLPVVVIGGLYTGFVTVTEAAGLGVAFSIFLSVVIYRSLIVSDIMPILMATVQTTCMVMMITCCSVLLGNVLTTMEFAQQLATWLRTTGLNAWQFLILVNVVLLLLGTVMDVLAILFIFIPIIFPLLGPLGIDPVWFAVMFVINMEIAVISPPVGLTLFVIAGATRRPVEEVTIGAMPFMAVLLLGLIIIGVFPSLSLWLPSQLMAR